MREPMEELKVEGDKVLVEIADGLERRTTRRLDLVIRLLEPVMLLILASVVLNNPPT